MLIFQPSMPSFLMSLTTNPIRSRASVSANSASAAPARRSRMRSTTHAARESGTIRLLWTRYYPNCRCGHDQSIQGGNLHLVGLVLLVVRPYALTAVGHLVPTLVAIGIATT